MSKIVSYCYFYRENPAIPFGEKHLSLGQTPNTAFLGGQIHLNPDGFIMGDQGGRTRIAGVFAAGDVLEGSFRQLVVACGSGANAALAAEQHLDNLW